ncbi:MAG: transposase [Streptosporangiaceae bacterium]
MHLLECGLLRGGYIPPAEIKAARDVIRYRTKVVQSRTPEIQRLGNVLHLDHIGHLEEMIAKLDAQIEAMMLPFRAERDLLTTIPGIGPLAAAAVLSEIGASVAEFLPDAAHLASWAGMCPGNQKSAGKRHSGKRRHGNQHLQPVLVEIAWAAVRHLHLPCSIASDNRPTEPPPRSGHTKRQMYGRASFALLASPPGQLTRARNRRESDPGPCPARASTRRARVSAGPRPAALRAEWRSSARPRASF